MPEAWSAASRYVIPSRAPSADRLQGQPQPARAHPGARVKAQQLPCCRVLVLTCQAWGQGDGAAPNTTTGCPGVWEADLSTEHGSLGAQNVQLSALPTLAPRYGGEWALSYQGLAARAKSSNTASTRAALLQASVVEAAA